MRAFDALDQIYHIVGKDCVGSTNFDGFVVGVVSLLWVLIAIGVETGCSSVLAG